MIASTASRIATPVVPRFLTAPRPAGARRAAFFVRATAKTQAAEAEAPSTSAAKPLPATYFYGGRAFTEEEWRQAKATGDLTIGRADEPAAASAAGEGEALGFGELLAFAGPAPELINGRLAMLAFISAVAAEFASGEGVVQQWRTEPTFIVLTAVVFAAATLFPMLETTKREAFGPFTPNAEVLNGRAAMIGFASLLAIEAARGGAALF